MRTRVQWLLPADAPIAFWRIESKSARVARLFKGGVVRRGHAVDGRGKNDHTRLAKNTKGERIRAVHVGLLEADTLGVSICRADAEAIEIAEALALPAPGLSPPEHTSVVRGATRPGAPSAGFYGVADVPERRMDDAERRGNEAQPRVDEDERPSAKAVTMNVPKWFVSGQSPLASRPLAFSSRLVAHRPGHGFETPMPPRPASNALAFA